MPKYVLSLILLAGSIGGVGCSEHHYNTYPPYYRSGGYYSGPNSGPYVYRPGRVYRGDARYREQQRERYRREQRERNHDYRR